MGLTVKDSTVIDNEQWISVEDVARMLALDPVYCGKSIRKGYLKGKIGYRSHSGRNFKYNLNDVLKIQQEATVPARKQ